MKRDLGSPCGSMGTGALYARFLTLTAWQLRDRIHRSLAPDPLMRNALQRLMQRRAKGFKDET